MLRSLKRLGRLALAATAAMTLSAGTTVMLGVATAVDHPAGAALTGCARTRNYVSTPGSYNGPTVRVGSTCSNNFYAGTAGTAAYFRGWWWSSESGWVEGTRGWVYTGTSSQSLLVTGCACTEHLQGQSDDWITSYY